MLDFEHYLNMALLLFDSEEYSEKYSDLYCCNSLDFDDVSYR